MKITKSEIGKKDRKKIYLIKFENNNKYKLEFINFGCYIKKIIIPHKNKINKYEDIIIGHDKLKDILHDKDSFNSIIGRVAGRISNASFILNKKKYNLKKNDGVNHLHGGEKGFNKKIWDIIDLYKNNNSMYCKLFYISNNLEEGYPGNLKCYATYKLDNKNQISIDFKAIADRDTIINLTNHNYWNFNGHNKYYKNISNHVLKINAKKYCKIDNKLLPTGKVLNVRGTKFDFIKLRKIGLKTIKKNGIDNYFIKTMKKNSNTKIIEVYSPLTKMGMEIFSNQPGIQFYTGNNMKKKYNGKKGKTYGKSYGLCFEPQKYPNAINTKGFPSILLSKNKIYQSTIKFCLKNDY